ncbi:MAG: helix-hairpin-helix domain-containing protein, partial [Opitutales bacterium]|nr:helix-hairpin-helix domain-containing protein [Opitutales bacterium]
EVVFRRFKGENLPDLILIDGGKGHVSAVKAVLCDMGIEIPVYGMVKDDRHKTRALCTDLEILKMNGYPNAFRLVTLIQDEAHRFAVDYNRRLRKKRYTSSELDNINGIGEKRKKALIMHFGSVKKIRKADIKELEAVEGVGKKAAETIHRYFKK